MKKLLYRAADRLLEATVALSYTQPGYTLRQRIWDEPAVPTSLDGRVVLITGANAGLGRAATAALADAGATVIMACRSLERGEAARDAILEETGAAPERLRLEQLDVSRMQEVSAFAARLRDEGTPLHVLINNAGVLLDARETTPEGLEVTLATNVLGGFLLTRALRPLLEASAPARVIHVTSGGMYTQKLSLRDLQWERRAWDGVVAYAQTKRAQVVLSELWAERLEGTQVSSVTVHPGWADTPGVERSLPRFHALLEPILRTPEAGADSLIWLAASPDLDGLSGELVFDRAPRRAHILPTTRAKEETRRQLWSRCEALIEEALSEGEVASG